MTKLSEVIHLYIGQEYDGICDDKPRKITHSNIETIMSSKLGVPKPILRPLSDITEEEKQYHNNIGTIRYWQYEQFAYLLNRGFDLFGLIESNQAIDKTKMG